MSIYRTPVLSNCESDPSVYYSWQERPECSELLHDNLTPSSSPQNLTISKERCGTNSTESLPSPDARLALEHIAKGRAKGDICALTFRQWLQSRLFNIGCVIDCHRWTILVVGCIVLGLCCLGLKTVRLETDVEKLWVQNSGRIAHELEHTRKILGERSSASSFEALLQTGTNLAHANALQDHLRLVSLARDTKVRLGSREYSFQNVCQKLNFGQTGNHVLQEKINQMTPCLIISPLDCFWDGAKLLGPDKPVNFPPVKIKWTNFDPKLIFELALSSLRHQHFGPLMTVLGRGYQNRTCLDPEEQGCPKAAPNYRRKEPVDVGKALRGGCPSFASGLMHWPEALLVGGGEHSASGDRLVRFRALQTLLVLRSPHSLYDERKNDPYIEWSLKHAQRIITLWKQELRKRVAEMDRREEAAGRAPGASPFSTSHFVAFTDGSLQTLLEALTRRLEPMSLGGAAILVALYLIVCFVRWKEPIASHTWVAIAAFVLCSLTVVAGLGIAAVLGLPFNVLTVKVMPVLLVGVSMDDCLRMTAQFDRLVGLGGVSDKPKMVLGEALKNGGPSLLLSSMCNIAAIFAGALLPVPLLQSFCLQTGLVSCLQLLNALFLLPALLSLDLQRRRSFRVDCLCCLSSRPENPLTLAGSPRAAFTTTAPAPPRRRLRRYLRLLSPRRAVRLLLVPALRCVPVKAFVVTAAAVAVGFSSFGLTRCSYGLDFASVVPRGSPEYSFVRAHHKYFGVYNFMVNTGDSFDYANGQRLLRRYFQALLDLPHVIIATSKDAEKGPPVFWLDSLRDWLLELQTAFRKDVSKGAINNITGSWNSNATEKGLIGRLLMVQTGEDDKMDLQRLTNGYLVDSAGIIFPRAFYNYLSAWRRLRRMEYEAVANFLRPVPKDDHLTIPSPSAAKYEQHLYPVFRAPRLEFTQMNFYLRDVRDSATMLRVVKDVREVTDKFTAAGLDTYPSGVPFIFFEQYFLLPRALALALVACFVSFFLALLLFFFNLRAVLLTLLMLAVTLLELCGLCSALGFHLNGASAAVLLLCSGLFARQQVPLLWTFLTTRGETQIRSSKALAVHGPSRLRAAVALLLALVLLCASPLDFIVTYFFQIISLAVLVGLFNAILLLPVLLALIGPPSQFRPGPGWSSSASLHTGLQPPSPPLGDQPDDVSGLPQTCANPHFSRPRPASLSTISEEPSRLSSSSSLDAVPPSVRPSVVFMEPEIVLRTSTGDSRCFAHTANNSGARTRQGRSLPQVCCHDTAANHVTTVKATAKFKVEVHSPSMPCTFENSSSSSRSGSSSTPTPTPGTSHLHKTSKRNRLPPPYQQPPPPQYSRSSAQPKPQRYLFPQEGGTENE